MVTQSSYFKLPERTKGKYQHPDLHIAQSRQYQGSNWFQTKDILTNNNQLFIPPYLFREALNHLRSGKQVYNEHGKKLPTKTITQILNEIYEQRDPWRAEWLGARFTQKDNTFYITHLVFDTNGQPQEVTEQLDQETLMEDKTPGISLEDWLKKATPQGLPKKKTKSGSLYYWSPGNGTVARFRAYSDRVGLSCLRDPQDSASRLGVRPVLLAEGKSKKIVEQIIPTQSTLDETIKQALELGKPFEHNGIVYVPTKDVILKK